MKDNLKIFIDGACQPNPGTGGVGIFIANKEIEETLKTSLNADMFIKRYSNVSKGPKQWQEIKTEKSSIYNWEDNST